MRGAYPVTGRDRREALHGSAGQAAGCPGLASRICGYPASKLQPSML